MELIHNTYQKGVPNLRTYAEAAYHFDQVAPFKGKNSDEKPVGQRNLRNRRMSRSVDGTINFGYYGDPICSWHPDGTVTAQALQQQRDSGYPNLIMPFGIHQDIGTRAGPILYLTDGKPNGRAHYSAGSDTENTVWHFWSERWSTDEDGTQRVPSKARSHVQVVRGDKPVHLKRDKQGFWRPTDLKAITPFEWSALDKSKARKVAQVARIPDFVAAMDAIIALGGEIPQFEGQTTYRWSRIQSDRVYEEALACIEGGNFVAAMALLRRDKPRTYDPVIGRSVEGPERIVSTELERIRTVLYKREGVLVENSRPTLTLPEYTACEGAMKRFC